MGLITLLILIVMPIIWLKNKIIGNSRSLLIKRLKKGHSGFFYASKKNKDDLEIVKIAVQCGSYNFGYASERIRSDENIVLDFIDIAPEIMNTLILRQIKYIKKPYLKMEA